MPSHPTPNCRPARAFMVARTLAAVATLGPISARAQERGLPPVLPDPGRAGPNPIIFVDADANGANNGLTWADAFTTLQSALFEAEIAGGGIEQIWVAEGTYRPDQGGQETPGDRGATFQLLSGTAVYGGFNGTETALDQRDPAVNVTVLSGDLSGDDVADIEGFYACFSGDGCAYPAGCAAFDVDSDTDVDAADGHIDDNSLHVVTGSGTDATAVLDGFVVSAGNAGNVLPDNRGGGLLNISGSPSVSGCAFEHNFAGERTTCSGTTGGGGGVYTDGSIAIDGCRFDGNFAAEDGAGVFVSVGASATIVGCDFTRNVVLLGGGAGVSCYNSTPLIVRCSFTSNTVRQGHGAAVESIFAASPTVVNCSLLGNSVMGNGGAVGVYAGGHADLTNCVFMANYASNWGGAISVDGGAGASLTLSNASLWANVSDNEGGGLVIDNGDSATIVNSIFWLNFASGMANEAAQIKLQGAALAAVDYSLIQGLTGSLGGTGNIGSNPLFVDANALDLRLQPGSPAIDAGDTTALPQDVADLDGDANTTESIPLDLDDNLRVMDDPDTPDTGVPGSSVVDMGAYEFYPDCNYNGIPDAQDILDGTSDDVNMDGIPDECIDWTGAVSTLWSVPGNWNDGVVPNNNGESVSVDIPSAVVDMDLDVVIDNLHLGVVALNIIDSFRSLTLDGPGGIDNDGGTINLDNDAQVAVSIDGIGQNQGSINLDHGADIAMSGSGDLNNTGGVLSLDNGSTVTIASGGLSNTGTVSLGSGCTITLSGAGTIYNDGGNIALTADAILQAGAGGVTSTGGTIDLDDMSTVAGIDGIGMNGDLLVDAFATVSIPSGQLLLDHSGRFVADPGAAGTVSALLSADSVLVNKGAPNQTCTIGVDCIQGTLELTDAMSMLTNGDLVLDGTGATPPPFSPIRRGGNTPPPEVVVETTGTVEIGGDIILLGETLLIIQFPVDRGQGPAIDLRGSLINYNTSPNGYKWTGGTLSLTGSAPQSIEVGGRDLGPSPDGFAPPGENDTNFSMPTINVADGRDVTFENLLANAVGSGDLQEALYVDTLVLGNSAEITIDGCHVYYNNLQDNGAVIFTTNGGSLEQVVDAPPVSAPLPEDVGLGICTHDADCAGAEVWCVSNTCYVSKNRYLSINPNPGNFGLLTARRVSIDLGGGQTHVLGWMSPPEAVHVTGPEEATQLISHFWPSADGTEPELYVDWNDPLPPESARTVQLGDCEISPGRTYLIQAIRAGSDVSSEANYSDPLILTTIANFGDVVGSSPGLPPDSVRNFKDISAEVRGFQSVQTEPKVWLDLYGGTATPEIPDFADINFADINGAVAGFQGSAYPLAAPCDCPGQVCP